MLDPHPLITKFERQFELTAVEREAITAIQIRPIAIRADQDLVREGDRPSRCVFVLEGLAGTSKIDETGKRQTLALHVPGDMPDLSSLHLEVLDSDIRTVSNCSIAFIEQTLVRALCGRHPRLSAALWRLTLIDAAVSREWLFNVGQRRGLNRVAHLFCEMFRRMEAIGQAEDGTCEFHLSQTELGHATGLSVVHINRMLQTLRGNNLVSFGNGRLTVHDWPGLSHLAGFRPDYLHIAERLVEPL